MVHGRPVIEVLRDGVVVVGTAHISQKSVDDVERTIRERQPAKVLVELDAKRFDALRDPDAWQKTDLIQILREKKQHLFLLQLYLANMQARMGRETGVPPGGEMIRAIEVADEIGAEVVLIDRDVSITLKRGFGSMNLWQRMRLFWNVWMELLTPGDKNAPVPDIDDLLETDAVTAMTEEFARFAPKIKTALIDERDEYMASHLQEQAATPGGLVAVVGAGHMPGIMRHFQGPSADRDALDKPPRNRITLGKIIGYGLPLFIVGAFVFLGVTGDFTALKENLLYWIIANGVLSAIGALLARGHILSALVALVAAPLTSLSPALAAGWFAGATEAKMHTPTVSDFQAINGIETMKDFYRNGVVRILLVTALANLGSVAGTWLGFAKIAQTLSGAGP